MTIQSGDSPNELEISQAAWRLDPARSSVEFHVRHFYGLVTVKGRFERFEGTLDLRSTPAVQLTIEADSLDTPTRPSRCGSTPTRCAAAMRNASGSTHSSRGTFGQRLGSESPLRTARPTAQPIPDPQKAQRQQGFPKSGRPDLNRDNEIGSNPVPCCLLL
jgi:YceI-like domain